MANSADGSISRRHGSIAVDDDDGNGRPKVRLRDLGSTFGTYVGEAAIASSGDNSQQDRLRGEAVLADGTRVRFGLHATIFKWVLYVCMHSNGVTVRTCSVSRLAWRPFVFTSSSLGKEERERMSKAMAGQTGLKTVSAWSDAVTHLAMSEVILTLKVVNALAKGVPVVTPAFVEEFLTCSASRQALPDPRHHVPRLNEQSLNAGEISCAVDPARRRLFAGKTFVFSGGEQRAKYAAAIGYAGGTAVTAATAGLPAACDIIVVQPPKQGAAAVAPSSAFAKLLDELRRSGLSAIPEQNIGLAILKVSCDTDCNPAKKAAVRTSSSSTTAAAAASSPRQQLAPETQQASTTATTRRSTRAQGGASSSSVSTRVVPETLPSSSLSASSSAAATPRRNGSRAPPPPPPPPPPEQQDTVMLEDVKAEEEMAVTTRKRTRANTEEAAAPAANKVKLEEEVVREAPSPRRSPRKRTRADPAATNAVAAAEEEEDLFQFADNGRTSPKRTSPDRSARKMKAANEEDMEEEEEDLFGVSSRRSPRKKGSKKVTPPSDVAEPTTTSSSTAKRSRREDTEQSASKRAKTTSKPSETAEASDRVAVAETQDNNNGFLSKAMLANKVRLSLLSVIVVETTALQFPPPRRDSAEDDDVGPTDEEELCRSYCQLEVVPLVAKRLPAPRYTPSSKPDDLDRPVKNFKRFKKQVTIRAPDSRIGSRYRVVITGRLPGDARRRQRQPVAGRAVQAGAVARRRGGRCRQRGRGGRRGRRRRILPVPGQPVGRRSQGQEAEVKGETLFL